MQKKYSDIIIKFLKSHPLISAKGLEEVLEMPQSTIGQALSGVRLIPVKHIYNIVCYLAAYGLEIDGYLLTYNQEDNTITGRKWVKNMKNIKEGAGFAYVVKEYRILATDYFDLC